ncbi:unnamed protein product [Chrysoparadoxa australica]
MKPSQSEKQHYGWLVCLFSAVALGVKYTLFDALSEEGLFSISSLCHNGFRAEKTWCSFDRRNGFQVADSCTCVKSCLTQEFHACKVNATNHDHMSYQALSAVDNVVYLDMHHHLDDVVGFLKEVAAEE